MKKSVEEMKAEKLRLLKKVYGADATLEDLRGPGDDWPGEVDEQILDEAWESVVTREDEERLDPEGRPGPGASGAE